MIYIETWIYGSEYEVLKKRVIDDNFLHRSFIIEEALNNKEYRMSWPVDFSQIRTSTTWFWQKGNMNGIVGMSIMPSLNNVGSMQQG